MVRCDFPTAIFSLLSLVSFAVDLQMVPGRLGLLVTLDLITMNTYNSVKAPPGRGFSYIEIWLVGIQIPILLAIFEYGILLTMKRCIKKQTEIDVWPNLVNIFGESSSMAFRVAEGLPP